MGRYKRTYNRNYRKPNYYAKKHIEEAERLSRELGGTDKDVKDWFFARSEYELNPILAEYKVKHGNKAYQYALETIPKWKSGHTKMSGMVAERLFNLLPDHMPLDTKYALVDSLWAHVGPQRKRVVEAGLESNIEDVISVVQNEVMSLATSWEIPDSLNRRFKWLGKDDSTTYQQLLSHIKNSEKDQAISILEHQLPIIRNNFESNWQEVSQSISYVIEIGKQSVELRLKANGDVVQVKEWEPSTNEASSDSEFLDWNKIYEVAFFLVSIFVIYLLLR